jgi:nucleotide-binding universal stress UspA family protein
MRLDRLAIGVDLTNRSTRAALWAARVFAPEARIALLHCVDPLLSDARAAGERQLAESALAALVRRIGTHRASYDVRMGDAARCLADLAAEVDADLIAVGAHEEHPTREPALGSTAQRLVRCSPVPVLLCTAAPSGTPRSVLLPLESGRVTTGLADWTHDVTEHFGARLALVHVEPPRRGSSLTSQRAAAARRDATRPWTDVARELPPERIFVDAMVGDNAEAVLGEARRFASDLVVLEAPESDDVANVSPFDRILLRSECPVLVIPPLEDAS